MNYVLLIVLVLIILVMFAAYWLSRLREKEQVMIRKIGDTELYRKLYPSLAQARQGVLSSVRLTGDEIVFRFLDRARPPVVFRFAENDLTRLNGPYLLALTQALVKDLPCLGDETRYSLVEKKARLSDGSARVTYVYELKAEYKRSDYGHQPRKRRG